MLDAEVVASGLEEQLVAERAQRIRAVRDLTDARERAAAEVTLLQHELDRRLQVQGTVTRQLEVLRAELTETQARIASDEHRRGSTGSVLAELGTTALQLRDELRSLEDGRLAVERELEVAKVQLAERDTRLAEQAAQIAASEGAMGALRAELEDAAQALRASALDLAERTARLDAAEQAVVLGEAHGRDLARRLADEQRDRERAEAELKSRLTAERVAFRSTIEENRLLAEGVIAHERAAFEAQVAIVRGGVASLRAHLGSFGTAMQRERAAREAAEALVAAERGGRAAAAADLEAARALVAAAEDRAHRAEQERDLLLLEVVTVRDELSAAQVRTRAAVARAHAAVVEAQDAADAAIGAARGFSGESASAATARAERAEAERDRLQTELETQTAGLDPEASLARLRGELSHVQAQTAAEFDRLQQQLRREQETAAHAGDRILELEDELERVRAALRPPPSMPPADHPALREGPAVSPDPPRPSGDPDSVIIDLARAAARLRIRREEALADPSTPDAPSRGAVPGDAVGQGEDPEPAATSDHDPAGAGPGRTAAAVPDPAVELEVELGPRAGPSAQRRTRSWLTPATVELAGRDPAAARDVLQALVPVQAQRLGQDLTYDVDMDGQAVLRVQLHRDGTADVQTPRAEHRDQSVDLRLAGSAEALAPLFGGGGGRRLPAGVTISGGRRRARRLARALRGPVALRDVAAAGAGLSCVQLLTLLMGALDATAGVGETFTVAFAETDGTVQAHVTVAGARPSVHPGPPAHADATVRTPVGGLTSFLAGDAGARVTGDAGVVGRLLAWVDTAQGLDA